MRKRAILRSFAITVVGVLILAVPAGAMLLHYLFQQPARQVLSRELKPEIEYQKGVRPSLKPLLAAADLLLQDGDPASGFAMAAEADIPAPGDWTAFVGPSANLQAEGPATVEVGDEAAFLDAVAKAEPGAVIRLRPGDYRFSGRSIALRRPGLEDRPITVQAARLGRVRLYFDLLEGFHLQAPYWRFENLVIEGACDRDSRCEHAFHIVGGAEGAVIRNNWIKNFNAAIKVNATPAGVPDGGSIIGNAFFNDRPRQTDHPVTTLDIVAASHWRVAGNVIADFAKAGGDRISYGAFFKGNGADNLFEGNLLRCEWRHRGGVRIGFSLGGGGTGDRYCAGGSCPQEQQRGIMRNNIVMNCPNDVGVYVNAAAATAIYNNAIIATRGIDVRFPQSDAVIVNNVIDGRILTRDGGRVLASDNVDSAISAALLERVSDSIYRNAAAGDFRLRDPGAIRGQGRPMTRPGPDICGREPESGRPDIGPIQYRPGMTCRPVLPQ